ncbi:MAG: hypothetical protein JNK89_04495 [Saprospiraceae bacterium]|nr:hypothetical protein [Saprospiraceae bacterium]
MKYCFLGAALLLTVFACNPVQTSEKTTASCYVRYLAEEGQLTAEFQLRTEKSATAPARNLELPEGVRYQGVLMQALSTAGPRYRSERATGYQAEHRFSWKGPEGREQEAALHMNPITAFSFEPAALSSRAPATMRWDGAPLEKGESLVMIWDRADGSRTVPMEIIGTPGQSQVDFPAAQMAKLGPGAWTIYLVRKKNIRTDTQGTAVAAALEYYTATKSFELQ